MWIRRTSRYHTLLARDPCWQLKNDFVLHELSHYHVGVQLKVIRVCSPRQEIGHPVFDLLGSGPIMRSELVLGELILMDRMHLVVVEVEWIFLKISRYHSVFRLPPFNRFIQTSEKPILLQLGLFREKIPAFLGFLRLVEMPEETGSWPDHHFNNSALKATMIF